MTDASGDMNGPGWPRAILFDLDGTLIDSVPDLASSVNHLLATEGFPALVVDEVRSMIGHGIKVLVRRAHAARGVEIEGEELKRATDRMMAIYGDRLVVGTTLMEGAADLVSACAAADVRVGVVTNKPEAFAAEILARLGLAGSVSTIIGGDTGPARKPAPDMLVEALARLDVSAADAVLVGDSPADIDAAAVVPMRSIAVRGGYTTVAPEDLGADLVIDSLRDLPAAFSKLREPA